MAETIGVSRGGAEGNCKGEKWECIILKVSF